MANFSGVNFSNATKMPNIEGDTTNVLHVPLEVIYIFAIVTNSITCPFTVLLNMLVIMAMKRKRQLQTNSNILLACLAATDALTGLVVQPSFILWMTSELLGVGNSTEISDFHNAFFYVVSYASLLHLMLVTSERLLAIKFTMRYLDLITERNIKITVTVFWIISFSSGIFRLFRIQVKVGGYLLIFLALSCILFVAFSYITLYRETRRHQKMIKTQQLIQEEVERFTKESKALKTTVFVVGAVIFCFLPGVVYLILLRAGLITSRLHLWVRTCAMLNSLLNPVIYCWRQREIRKFVFRMRCQVVHPAN